MVKKSMFLNGVLAPDSTPGPMTEPLIRLTISYRNLLTETGTLWWPLIHTGHPPTTARKLNI